MSVLDELKFNYNYNLKRYYNADNFLEKHPKQVDKWIKEALEIKENLDVLLNEILKEQEVSKNEILNGFQLGE